MSFKFNPFTGTFDIVTKFLNKLVYTNEVAIVQDNTFLIHHQPVLLGTSQFIVKGTGVLRIE